MPDPFIFRNTIVQPLKAPTSSASDDGQDVSRARTLALTYGWNATAYQVVNPGIKHWFTDDREALVGFVRAGLRLPGGRVRVVAGAPVCAPDRLLDVVQAFEAEARRQGEAVCYFGAAGRLMETIGNRPGYSTVALGAQPIWNPAQWAETVDSVSSLRAQLARARNKKITVEEWPADKAQDNPDLCRCLGEWLATRPLPPLGFLVEPQTLSRLTGRRIWVALRDGVPVGFVTCSPVGARQGWLTEQFVRGVQAPNGTTELMLDSAVRTLAQDGARYVTMGLVPLASRSPNAEADIASVNPSWLRFTLKLVRAHGRRFYNFDGLERFKAKFRPHDWETIYAVTNEAHFHPRTLYAIADAFAGGTAFGPIGAVARGAWKALRQEAVWLWQAIEDSQ